MTKLMRLSRLRVRGLRASSDSELEIVLPGRFAVLVGANASGKTTVSDAMYLVHPKRFPQLPRLSAAALGEGDRLVEVEYSFDPDPSVEGPLGRHLQAQTGRNVPGTVATMWSKTLRRSLGRVATQNLINSDLDESMYLVHLPAWRNPLDELARRETRILIELLRAQQQNIGLGRDLTGLRARASALLESLATDDLLKALEGRVDGHLRALSAGVSRAWPYIRGQVVDDQYLARVLELMLAVLEGRQNARPLEVAGLGYVNLLHIAVTTVEQERMRAASVLLRVLRRREFLSSVAGQDEELRVVIAMADDSIETAFSSVGADTGAFLAVLERVAQGVDRMTVVHVDPEARGGIESPDVDCPIHPQSTVGMLLEYLRTQRGKVTCRVVPPDRQVGLLSDGPLDHLVTS
jgi:putative ATP-dependent endonuclease of the OLD family